MHDEQPPNETPAKLKQLYKDVSLVVETNDTAYAANFDF